MPSYEIEGMCKCPPEAKLPTMVKAIYIPVCNFKDWINFTSLPISASDAEQAGRILAQNLEDSGCQAISEHVPPLWNATRISSEEADRVWRQHYISSAESYVQFNA